MMKSSYKVIRAAGTRFLSCVAIIAALLFGTPAAFGESEEPIEDWVRNCDTTGEFADKCFVRQRLTLKNSGDLLFEIAAGYPLGGDLPMLLLSAPLGIFLPAGITIEVDDTGEYRAVVAYCNHDGCHAYYRMTDELYRMFRLGRSLNVSFLDGTRRAHRFQVSLNGFSAAIDSVKGN